MNFIDLTAAIQCAEVYRKNKTIPAPWWAFLTKTTQYSLDTVDNITYLNVCGTNQAMDWVSNVDPASWKGIKLGGYLEAKRLYKEVGRPPGPLCVTGHSRGAPSAVAFAIMYGADYCRLFSPARSLRRWFNAPLKFDCKIFIDPDDPVPYMLAAGFRHPDAPVVYSANDKLLPSVGDHAMDRWVDFIKTEG
jgi:hypothetical protein